MTDETIRRPLMSGHCGSPSVAPNGETSHERCHRQGGGQRANPDKQFQPCPCECHYGEEYTCGSCGMTIREAPLWPYDEDGDMRYTHIDRTGRAIGEDCVTRAVSRNDLGAALAEIEAEADEADEPIEGDDVVDSQEPEPDEAEPDEWDDLLSEFADLDADLDTENPATERGQA